MIFMRARIYFFGVLIAILFLFANCLSYGNIEDRVTKAFQVGSGGTLTLESDIGSVTIEGTNTDSVEIEILRQVKTNEQKKADEILEDFDIQFTHIGNDISIEAKYKKRGPRRFWNRMGNILRVKFIITVPSEYNVDLNTKGGSISVQDLQGEVLSETSGGSLKFDNIEGDITGKTSGGSITVDEVMGTIKAHTSGGSVKAHISKQPDSDCRLTTSGGSITVHLSADLGLDVNAKTSGGRVNTDFPVAISGEVSKRSMHAQMNGGGPELYLRTSGGSIYLKKL